LNIAKLCAQHTVHQLSEFLLETCPWRLDIWFESKTWSAGR